MSAKLSPFSQWALDGARSADERYLIFLLCDQCRLEEHHQKPLEYRQTHIIRSMPWEFMKELYLNPLLVPGFGPEDTERAAAMVPFLKKFVPGLDYEKRRIGEAGAVLRFFTALEELELGNCGLKNVSFVEALPNLRKLQINSGVLEDLGPLRGCTSLRNLSLGFNGSGPPHFTPPLYWLDARAMGALVELEKLTIHPNAAILSGLSFPNLKTADLSGLNCIQPDCTHLPAMPALRVLKLDGVQSLRGISRFPELRLLRIGGPLRDFGDIAELKHLCCLEVDTMDGWPRDVSPLTELSELLWLRFGGEIPRNYWPLAQAPRLCQLEAPQSKSVQLDVQAVNAVLQPWDGVFKASVSRPHPPLRFVVSGRGADPGVVPRGLPEPGPDFLANPKLFHLELLWMHRRVCELLHKFDAVVDVSRHSIFAPHENCWERSISNIELHTISAAQQLPAILDALRELMADSPHAWLFHVTIDLRLTKLEMTAQQKKWLGQIEEQARSREDGLDLERYQKTKQHIIDTQFLLRTSKEEGETPDPEDFVPPQDIRSESYQQAAPVPAGKEDDKDAVDNPDFALKPFDEQEQNSDDDGDGDDDVSIAPPPEPPQSFFDDPYSHPLADSYRFYAILTFDSFYHHAGDVATIEQLMGRAADEYHPAPTKKE